VGKRLAVNSVPELEVALRKTVEVVGPRKEAQRPPLLSLGPALLEFLCSRGSTAPAHSDGDSSALACFVPAFAPAHALDSTFMIWHSGLTVMRRDENTTEQFKSK
jgi:hypothetical protein